jgi:hypothetical protein
MTSRYKSNHVVDGYYLQEMHLFWDNKLYNLKTSVLDIVGVGDSC